MYDITPVTSLHNVDCGPCSLKMLLAYYGQDVELDTLINECNTRLIGCSAKDIIRVGTAHGLDMAAYSVPAEDMYNDDRPSILWWKYNHFVVYCGLNEDGDPVICNPSRGRYSISKGVFKSYYSGVQIANGEPQEAQHEA